MALLLLIFLTTLLYWLFELQNENMYRFNEIRIANVMNKANKIKIVPIHTLKNKYSIIPEKTHKSANTVKIDIALKCDSIY